MDDRRNFEEPLQKFTRQTWGICWTNVVGLLVNFDQFG